MNEIKQKIKKIKMFKSDSTMTEEDAIQMGKELNEHLAKRRYKK